MSTQLTSLFQQAKVLPQVPQQAIVAIRQVAAYTRPDRDDADQALALGHKEGISALLGSPKLGPDERIELATYMLQKFAQDPLAAPRQGEVLKTLLENGADPVAQDPEGYTPLDRIVARLEKAEAAEISLTQNGPVRQHSGASQRLRQLRDELGDVMPLSNRTHVDVDQFISGLGHAQESEAVHSSAPRLN